ncbi:MAG TPA: M20/M25/M40 family metallo-hydrolase [Acidimicrobiales bacterium]|nr:M20/M25/M40 family metallo-hydrolase [Acidimicrobiales bacterium]
MTVDPAGRVDLAALAAEVLERTVEIAGVPAPTGGEQQRAVTVAEWWRRDGFAAVSSDPAGNCWATVRDGSGPAIVLAAHLDTVFGPETEHGVARSGGRLVGPGVGDDAVALGALGAVGRLLASSGGSLPVLLLATVGEEGLGNLAGARHAVAHPPVELAAFIAIEGNYLGRIGTTGVGSRRWRVSLSGPGGHAWEEAGAPSALHEAARVVHALSSIPTVAGSTSLNVGRLSGGEAINARAREASFELDLRGADERSLDGLEAAARSVLDGPVAHGLSIGLVDIGRRPAGRIDAGHPLVGAARAALEARSIAWREVASSTDANAAHAAGLPALALGVTIGSGEHTPQEWIEIGPVADGIAALSDTVVRYEQAVDAAGAREGRARE